MKINLIAALTAAIVFQAPAKDTEVRVFVSNGVKAVMEELQPQCERAIGHPLVMQFGSTASLIRRIEAGETFDAAFLTTEAIDGLIREGKLAAATRADVGRAGIGVAVRKGAPMPDIDTPEAMKRTLLKMKSITYAKEGASRVDIDKMMDRLGIATDVKSKTLLPDASGRPQQSVEEGQSELVMTLIPEILPYHGIQLVGPLPSEFQKYVTFAADAATKTNNAEAAKALIKFVTGPAAAPTFKAKGMEAH
jgi:molybdate transport system substrate-binding protein